MTGRTEPDVTARVARAFAGLTKKQMRKAQPLSPALLADIQWALHSIACEPCKQADLCVADVVPPVIAVLHSDPDARLRIKALPVLLGLGDRDPRVREAIRAAVETDPDPLVRSCARAALDGRFVMPRKRYERSQRRHGVGKQQPARARRTAL